MIKAIPFILQVVQTILDAKDQSARETIAALEPLLVEFSGMILDENSAAALSRRVHEVLRRANLVPKEDV